MENNDSLSDVLSSNYMLASLTVRKWSASKKDKTATHDLLIQKGAASNAASVVKSLLAGNDAELRDTWAAYDRIRTWFYANSLPWTSDTSGAQRGDRLVGTLQALEFLRDFAGLKADAEAARDKFLAVYDAAVANASVALGGLYDVNQYPSKEEVRTMFDASLGITPMPAVADFDRVSIPGAMAEGLKDMYVRTAEKQAERAVIDAQERVSSELCRLVTQLDKVVADEPVRLHKSLLTTMETVAGLAKSLGPISPELEQIADEISTKLLKHDIEAYKGNASLARSTSESAKAILSGMTANPKNLSGGLEPGVANVPTTEPSVLVDSDFDFDEEAVYQ